MFWLVDLANSDLVGWLDHIFHYLNLKLSRDFVHHK